MGIIALLLFMAKQTGAIKITGAIGNICFYKLEGEFYARRKSSLDRNRVKRDPAFKETMKHAKVLANASVIGSAIYRSLPTERKGRKVYQYLTGRVMQLLKQGIEPKNIAAILQSTF